jgi:hypothetical protein
MGTPAGDSTRATDSDVFAGEVRRLADGLRRLPAARWRGRRDAVRDVVQRLADLAADLEGEPRRTVPRLEGDPSLADQLAVVADDLARAAAAGGRADVLAAARAELERVML